MLFFLLQKYPNIRRAVINDINPHLITTYRVIRDNPYKLIDSLKEIQEQYRSLQRYEVQKEFYLQIRNIFNTGILTDIQEATYMIFMNRTCFNGLYRENSKGAFNVPFGRYLNPTICDEPLILSDSELLQNVEILNGDFADTGAYMDGYTFFYFDPPYRPLDETSSFNSYVKEAFGDEEQRRLKDFFTYLSAEGCFEMLSNSDGRARGYREHLVKDKDQQDICERKEGGESVPEIYFSEDKGRDHGASLHQPGECGVFFGETGGGVA